MLSVFDLNPASHESQGIINKSILELVGFGKAGGAQTVARCTDLGAADIKSIIKDEVKEFWVLVAWGHAEMAVTRLAMKIVVALFGEHFIYAHKFRKGTGGPGYLKSCGSNHKAWTFTQLMSEALQLELVKQYLLDNTTPENYVYLIPNRQLLCSKIGLHCMCGRNFGRLGCCCGRWRRQHNQ